MIRKVFRGSSYCREAKLLIARMTTNPNPNQKRAINKFILTGKAAGWWSKLDALWMPAPWAEQAFTLNWIGDEAFDLVKHGTLTFTADGGWSSTGASNYAETNFVALTDGTNFTLNSGRLSVLSDVAPGNIGTPFGRIGRSANIDARANAFGGGINQIADDAYNNTADINADEALFAISRRGASEIEGYKDGVSLGSFTTAAVNDQPLMSLLLFAVHQGGAGVISNYFTGKIRHASIGAGFSDAEEASFHAAFAIYDAAVNA